MIRAAEEKDVKEVIALAEKHNLSVPLDASVIVKTNSAGKIEGFIALRNVIFIEPFVCENPVAAKKLWDYCIEGCKTNKIKILRCFAQEKHTKLFKKLGFYRIFKKYNSMEINFWKGN